MGLQDRLKAAAGTNVAATETKTDQTTTLANQRGVNAQEPAAGDGGSAMSNAREAMRTTSVAYGGRKNDFPVGTGIFLLKDGTFSIKSDGKYKISEFVFVCLKPTSPGPSGIPFGGQGYDGAVPGQEYAVSIFQDYSPKYVKGTMTKNLAALQSCMGWTADITKKYQDTDEGFAKLEELMQGLVGCTLNGTPTNVPCMFANQVVLKMSSKVSIVKQVDKETKQPMMVAKTDGSGGYEQVTKSYLNTYWNEKILLEPLLEQVDEAVVADAFGGEDAVMAAMENEKFIAEFV